MAAPSFDDLYTIAKAELQLRRPDLFASPGDVSDFILAAIAAAADKAIQHANEEMRKTFVDGATGDDLTVLISDHYGITRQEATAAQVTIGFTRSVFTAGAGSIPAGTTVATEIDISGERQEFTTDAIVTWGATEVGTKTVTATAVNEGVAGNVDAATITDIVSSIFDANITCSNAAVAAGGNAEESDAQLRERARLYPSTIRRGTSDAIVFGALQVPSVRIATVHEDSGGNATLYVADEAGGSTAEMVLDVETELDEWRCAGVPVTVTGGYVLEQDIDISLTVRAGTDVVALEADIVSAIENRLLRLAVGNGEATSLGVLRRELIQSAAMSVAPDKILGVTVNDPVADIVPDAGQIIRAGTITVS